MLLKCKGHFNNENTSCMWATIETSEQMHYMMWATSATETTQMGLKLPFSLQRSQVSVFKPALFAEHSNADKMKRCICTVADSVATVGESGDRDRCLGASVAQCCQITEAKNPESCW